MVATTSYGSDIQTLDSHLAAYSAVLGSVDTSTLERRRHDLNNRSYQQSKLKRRLGELRKQKHLLEQEIRGIDRLVDAIGGEPRFDPVDGDRTARLDRRRKRLSAELAAVETEREHVAHDLVAVGADIRGSQAGVIEAFEVCLSAAAAAEAEAVVARRAAAAREASERVSRDRISEMWSPVPLVGYRAWDLTHEGFKGAWRLWTHPEFSAVCGSRPGVPHVDGRCSRVAYGCGVYAAKSLDRLIDEYGLDRRRVTVVGRVALLDRVVEHALGFRAGRVCIDTLAVVDDGEVRVFTGQQELELVLAHPELRSLGGNVIATDVRSSSEVREILKRVLVPEGEQP